jgi:hypothetical protein
MAVVSTVLIAAAALCGADSSPHSVAVVELYTSQGCSSCPPADRWLGTLPARFGERIVTLSMHVGYWDYIGWKDPFARREFNERQRLLAAASGSGAVYTPGVFLQGREFAHWSRTATFDAAVQAALRRPAPARIGLTVSALSSDGVSVQARGDAPRDARLWLALVESGLTTAVKAGENRGETLRNDHVVRDWHGPFAVGEVARRLAFPSADASAARDRWAVVALVDDASGRTLQAVRLPLAQCAATRAHDGSRVLPQNTR